MQTNEHARIVQLEARVRQLETMMHALLLRLDINPAEVMPPEPLEPPQMKAIREAVLSGNKIEAIKLYRYLYGVGLKEAKDAIDAM